MKREFLFQSNEWTRVIPTHCPNYKWQDKDKSKSKTSANDSLSEKSKLWDEYI